MARINKWWIMATIFLFIILWWFRDPFKPYDTMPFSIEPYVAYDSIQNTFGFPADSLKKPIYRNYLITGFANREICEHKIDSILPFLVDTFINYKNVCYIHFFKKSNKCNNDYTRWDREWVEINANTNCLFVIYDLYVANYPDNIDIASIIKKRTWKSAQGYSQYHVIWNGNYPDTMTVENPIELIPKQERNIPMERLLDTVVYKIKESGKYLSLIHI